MRTDGDRRRQVEERYLQKILRFRIFFFFIDGENLTSFTLRSVVRPTYPYTFPCPLYSLLRLDICQREKSGKFPFTLSMFLLFFLFFFTQYDNDVSILRFLTLVSRATRERTVSVAEGRFTLIPFCLWNRYVYRPEPTVVKKRRVPILTPHTHTLTHTSSTLGTKKRTLPMERFRETRHSQLLHSSFVHLSS